MKNREIPMNIDFEIINVQPMNQYISDCEIKVFYHGKNRNGSYISKAVGNQIANTLPKTPIVAFYNEQIGDYEDHGQEIIINKNGIKFISKTVPYGAVSETAPIVWKQFIDPDGITREYMVCKGYLWTGRYPHLNSVLENTKAQSMEFFPESVIGDWAKFDNDEQEFFIFNEASISALCILGDDVEPCFEGAAVSKPEVLYSLKKDEFKQEFNNFMQELNKVLTDNLEEGGNVEVKNPKEDFEIIVEPVGDPIIEEVVEPAFEQTEEPEVETIEEPVFEQTEESVEEIEEPTEDPTFEQTEELIEEPTFEQTEEPKEEETIESKFQILQDQFATLENDYNILKDKYEILLSANNSRATQEKEVLCEKFAILGEEVLETFKTNLDKYTLEELEEKLSAIAFKKGISFNLIAEDGIITPNPQHNLDTNAPAWIKAVDERVNNNK